MPYHPNLSKGDWISSCSHSIKPMKQPITNKKHETNPRKTHRNPPRNKMLRKFLAFLGLAMPQERQKMLSAKGVSPHANRVGLCPVAGAPLIYYPYFLVAGGKVVLGRFRHRFFPWLVVALHFYLRNVWWKQMAKPAGKTYDVTCKTFLFLQSSLACWCFPPPIWNQTYVHIFSIFIKSYLEQFPQCSKIKYKYIWKPPPPKNNCFFYPSGWAIEVIQVYLEGWCIQGSVSATVLIQHLDDVHELGWTNGSRLMTHKKISGYSPVIH